MCSVHRELYYRIVGLISWCGGECDYTASTDWPEFGLECRSNITINALSRRRVQLMVFAVEQQLFYTFHTMVWIQTVTVIGHPRGYCGTAGSTQPPFSFTFKSANTGPGAAKQKRNGCSVAYRLLWFNCTTCYILISYADSQLKLGYCSTFFSEQSHMNTDGYGQYYDHTTLLSCCMSATGLQLHDC